MNLVEHGAHAGTMEGGDMVLEIAGDELDGKWAGALFQAPICAEATVLTTCPRENCASTHDATRCCLLLVFLAGC